MGHLSPSARLAATPLFAGVAPAVLARFDTGAHWVRLAGGETLFRQGDPADALYVVARGNLLVIVLQEDGRERPVDRLGRGAIIGEMALLLDDARTATVVACRDSELIRIDRKEFDALIVEDPSVAIGIARTLGARLKRTSRTMGLSREVRTIALVPISPGVSSAAFGARLVAAMAMPSALTPGGRPAPRPNEICLVSPERVTRDDAGDPDADPASADDGRVMAWMSALEDDYRHVIYQADPARPEWTRRCVRAADVVLLVASGADDLAPVPFESAMALAGGGRTPIELVLLHGAGAPAIAGTARWLQGRAIARHHHVRADAAGDLARVARFLTGRAVGLVLSGGGARALAHLGVLRALEAHAVPIDAVGGASMGAIIGALYATGRSLDAVIDAVRREFAGRQEPDLTLPVVSLYSGAATVRKLKRLFGDVDIEDLPVGFFCTSTNLTRAQSIVHDCGPLWLWTRASCAVPGLAPPVARDGDLLVDGGVLNNLPADVMRERSGGFVVGVDVTPGADLRRAADSRPFHSGWSQFAQRLTAAGRAAAFPGIVDILSRTALVGSIRDASRARASCDLYLEPAVERFSMGDFGQIDALIEAGFEAADAALAGRE